MARFVAVLLILAVAGCSKSPEAQTPTAAAAPQPPPGSAPAAGTTLPQDACTLVSDEEFQQATGLPVLARKSFPGEVPGCEWQLDTGGSGVHRISMDIRAGGRERFDFMSSGSLKKIPDLGDGAVQTGGNIDGTVWALKGDSLVTLRYSLPVSTADPNPVVVPLIRMILSRL